MKKFLATLLVVAMVVALAACGKEEKKNAKGSLTLWCIAVEGDANHEPYVKAIADMKERYPDVEFKWESTQNDDYKLKIKTAMQGNDVADIFFTWSCAFLGDFVQNGKVYCLDDMYKNYADKLPESMCRNTTYNGKKYGVPLTMNVVTLYANLDLLAKVGYSDVPKNYDELIDCCDKLVAAGIVPFGCAGAADQEWCITEYIEPLIIKTAGAQVMDDIFQGKISWNNEGVIKAIDTFQDFQKKGYFSSDDAGLNNDQVVENFIAGNYAFYQNGSWNCSGLSEKATFNVKACEFPVIDSSKSKLGQLTGGPNDTLAVFSGTKDPELAAKYAFELGQLICKYCYLSGAGLPAWKVDYPADNINALTVAVAKMVEESNYLVLFGDNLQSAEATDVYLKEIRKAYNGEVDGAKFASDLAAAIK